MKRIAMAVVILLFFNTLFGQDNIDVLHYKFEIGLSDKNDSVKGKASVTLKFTQASNQCWLSLSSPREGRGMIAHQVREDGELLNSKHRNDTIQILLHKPAAAGEVRTFEILYAGIPFDGLIISRNKFGDRTFFSDNWPNRAHNWIPCKDDLSDKATFEFIVTAPSKYRVVSNGKLEEEKILPGDNKLTHWKEDVPLPTKVMVIGVAKFAVKEFEDSPANTPVSAWVYPHDSISGFRNYSVAPGIVKFYSEYIGAYPYNKLANVQSKTIFGGMENASAIFYNEGSAEEDRSVEDLMAHEIAHQWFGDMVTEKKFSHLWLSEGFATYMTDIYVESRYGRDAMNSRLNEERRKVIDFERGSDRPVVDSVSPPMQLLSPISYEKGGWVLHMLRKQISDSAFHKLIRTFYDRYKGKNADTEDLQRVAEEISGTNLSQFFRQWAYMPGIPKLNIQSKYDKQTEELSVTVTQLQHEIFQFPLEFEIDSAEQKGETAHVMITKQTETFTFRVQQRLLRVIVDPNTSLLFEEVKK